MIGAQIRASRLATLLWRFYDDLSWFRIVADHDKTTVIRRHRLRRVRRADDRERLHCEYKTKQDAERERPHIAVSLCIIRAIEILIPRPGSVGKRPPAGGESAKRVSVETEDRYIRIGYRDNMRAEGRNN
jgi:hypothetical protein